MICSTSDNRRDEKRTTRSSNITKHADLNDEMERTKSWRIVEGMRNKEPQQQQQIVTPPNTQA